MSTTFNDWNAPSIQRKDVSSDSLLRRIAEAAWEYRRFCAPYTPACEDDRTAREYARRELLTLVDRWKVFEAAR